MSEQPPPSPTPHASPPSFASAASRDRFEALVAEADAVSVDGWDFSWLDGRATEQRPSWGYARAMADRLAGARAALDIQTGGGEVLAAAPVLPPVTVATESWPPNIARATARLHPLGAVVVADADEPPLPFGDGAFDLVVSRHPVTIWWEEIARVLAPGGTYFSQQVGPASVFELVEYFLGPQPPEVRRARDPEDARAAAEAATSSARSRPRCAAPATPRTPAPPPRPPGWTSSACGPSGCAPSSSTSGRSSTSSAR